MPVRNPGPPLVSDLYAEHDDVPREFKAKYGVERVIQYQPVSVMPDLLANTLISSSVIQERTNERKKVNLNFIGDWTKPLIESEFVARTGLVGTVTRSLVPEGTKLTVDTFTEEASQKNLGVGKLDQRVVQVPLVFPAARYSVAATNVTPEVFKAQIPELTSAVTATGTALPPTLGPDDIEISQTQETAFHFRTDRRFQVFPPLPLTFVDSSTNRFKQVETRVRVLELDTTLPQLPTPTQDVTFEKLGDGTALETRRFTANIFTEQLFEASKPDVTPEVFKAIIPITTDEHIIQGTASPPTLLSGQYFASQKQENVFVYRNKLSIRNQAILPVTIVDSFTNREKQVVTRTRILELDTAIPATPTTLLDVKFEKLGDGTAVETRESIPEVFDPVHYAIEFQNVLPVDFRDQLPVSTFEFTGPGDAVIPSGVTGTLSISDERVSGDNAATYTHHYRSVAQTIPTTFPLQKLDYENTEQYGGGQLVKIRSLWNTPQVSDTGFLVTESSARYLGATGSVGLWVKETKQLNGTAWPIMVGYKFDEEMQAYTQIITQTMDLSTYVLPAVGTYGAYSIEDAESIDAWRVRRVRKTRIPTATSVGTALISLAWRPYRFPGYAFPGVTAGSLFVRGAFVTLTQHIIRTWWVTGGLPAVSVVTFIMDNPIQSSLNNFAIGVYMGECLHDAFSYGGLFFPATNVGAAAYRAMIGTEQIISADITQTDIPNLWKIVQTSVVMR